MKLTVELLKNARNEALKKDAHVYIVESNGEPDIVVNSASRSTFKSMNIVILSPDLDEIYYGNLIYNNYKLSLQEFCNLVNEKYDLI